MMQDLESELLEITAQYEVLGLRLLAIVVDAHRLLPPRYAALGAGRSSTFG